MIFIAPIKTQNCANWLAYKNRLNHMWGVTSILYEQLLGIYWGVGTREDVDLLPWEIFFFSSSWKKAQLWWKGQILFWFVRPSAWVTTRKSTFPKRFVGLCYRLLHEPVKLHQWGEQRRPKKTSGHAVMLRLCPVHIIYPHNWIM